jgi:hypothetical protein
MPPRQGQLNGINPAMARGYVTARGGKVGAGGTAVIPAVESASAHRLRHPATVAAQAERQAWGKNPNR